MSAATLKQQILERGRANPARRTLSNKVRGQVRPEVSVAAGASPRKMAHDSAGAAVHAAKVGTGCVLAFGVVEALYHGEPAREAFRHAAIDAAESGSVSFVTAATSDHLVRYGAERYCAPLAERLVAGLPEKATNAIGAQSGLTCSGLTSVQAARLYFARVGLTAAVSVVVLTAPDLVRLLRRRLSAKQFLKNAALTTVGVGGTTAGYLTAGAALGSIVPGVGTAFGGAVGAVVGGAVGAAGAILGGVLFSWGASKVLDRMIVDDAVGMSEIVAHAVGDTAAAHALTDDERERLTARLLECDMPVFLRDVFAQPNESRHEFCKKHCERILSALTARQSDGK